MAIKNLVTLGLGCSPGSTKYLLLTGLGIGAVAAIVDLTLTDAAVTLLTLSNAVVTNLVMSDAVVTSLAMEEATRS